MTVVAAVKVADGVALGTDSVTLVFSGGTTKTWRAAPKLFQLAELPVGVMVYGRGSIGGRSVGGIVRDFASSRTDSAVDVAPLVADLYSYVRQLHAREFPGAAPDPTNTVGFVVAGYGEGQSYAHGYEFVLPRDREVLELWSSSEPAGAAVWRGVTGPMSRLLRGYDARIPHRLQSEGLSADRVAAILEGIASPISVTAMPVKDAVSFVRYMLLTTIGLAELEPDPAPVSEPLQIAAITPDQGFRWLRRIELN